MLWDGETTSGWRGVILDEFPNKGWVIEDGLIVLSTGGAQSAAGGDIIT